MNDFVAQAVELPSRDSSRLFLPRSTEDINAHNTPVLASVFIRVHLP